MVRLCVLYTLPGRAAIIFQMKLPACTLFCCLFFLSWSLAAGSPLLTHGVASGDVTDTSAIIWVRVDRAATLQVVLGTGPDLSAASDSGPFDKAQDRLVPHLQDVTPGGTVTVGAETDFTGTLSLNGLTPATRYYYRVWVSEEGRQQSSNPRSSLTGSFITAPAAEEERTVTFIWSGDLGGQGFCRPPEYKIFRAMIKVKADFFLFNGDTIYADTVCPSPPNVPGSDFVATTLEEFRAKHKYNRADPLFREFLASTSVYALWDDHEVTNDFAGPTQPLMPMGRQAFFEYYPIRRFPEDPNRLYRKFRWGKTMEMFILDNRQYRDRNRKRDGLDKTMLGEKQLSWLLESLAQSPAAWKIIVSSVPLSVPTGRMAWLRGRDGWASGYLFTGFETELLKIIDFIRTHSVRNVLWLTTDIHFAQSTAYDPDKDGAVDFHELASGPLSAALGEPASLDPTLNPEVLYQGSGFYNFGVVRIDGKGKDLVAEIRDQKGAVRFTLTLKAAKS